jgi:hypothetical protein
MTIAQPDHPPQGKTRSSRHKRITTAGPPLDHQPFTLKDALVNIGMNALRDGDQRRVRLVTLLLGPITL